jgi:hypothetical protein
VQSSENNLLGIERRQDCNIFTDKGLEYKKKFRKKKEIACKKQESWRIIDDEK